MVYTNPKDGGTAPSGSDAFNPPVQHKATVDSAADYHNRKIYATAAAMNADTYALKGWRGFTTDEGKEYRHDGTGWVLTPAAGDAGVPFRTAGGKLTAVSVVPGGAVRTAVVFPAGRFSVPPLVIPSRTDPSREITVGADNVTALGFDLMRGYASDTGVTRTGVTAAWVAIQMTSTDASG